MSSPEKKAAERLETATLERAERLLHGLTGIVSARIVADGDGRIQEIHVLTDAGVEPKQTVRNVESALQAQLDLKVDHRKISVAQTRGGDDPQVIGIGRREGPGRYVFVGYEFERKLAHRVECRVTLRQDGEEYVGTAEGADIESARLSVAAQAALRALELAEDSEVTFALDGVKVIDVFDRPVVLVGIHGITGRVRALLAGSVAVTESLEHATILATLQATNRWLSTP